MRSRSRGLGVPVVAVVLALMAGCSVNSTFVYKPGAPAAGGPKLPLKVAVLPFKDGTEDFTDRGSVFISGGQYNVAKAGIAATMTALTPELWAKSFAEDLAASGVFRSVRFIYGPSELVDEDISIEGTLTKAYVGKMFDNFNEFAVSLRALTRSDKRIVWEKEVTRRWKTPGNTYAGCGMGMQCSVDKFKAEYNKAMQGMFAEARADLVATLSSNPGGRPEAGGLPVVVGEPARPGTSRPSAPPAPESTEQTIERILKGK